MFFRRGFENRSMRYEDSEQNSETKSYSMSQKAWESNVAHQFYSYAAVRTILCLFFMCGFRGIDAAVSPWVSTILVAVFILLSFGFVHSFSSLVVIEIVITSRLAVRKDFQFNPSPNEISIAHAIELAQLPLLFEAYQDQTVRHRKDHLLLKCRFGTCRTFRFLFADTETSNIV